MTGRTAGTIPSARRTRARAACASCPRGILSIIGVGGKLAGTHRGREAVFAFLGTVSALTGDTFHLDLEDVTASDRHAVALFRGHGARNGKVLDNPTCLRMRIDGGRIAEVWEFVWDLYAVDDFWA